MPQPCCRIWFKTLAREWKHRRCGTSSKPAWQAFVCTAMWPADEASSQPVALLATGHRSFMVPCTHSICERVIPPPSRLPSMIGSSGATAQHSCGYLSDSTGSWALVILRRLLCISFPSSQKCTPHRPDQTIFPIIQRWTTPSCPPANREDLPSAHHL